MIQPRSTTTVLFDDVKVGDILSVEYLDGHLTLAQVIAKSSNNEPRRLILSAERGWMDYIMGKHDTVTKVFF